MMDQAHTFLMVSNSWKKYTLKDLILFSVTTIFAMAIVKVFNFSLRCCYILYKQGYAYIYSVHCTSMHFLLHIYDICYILKKSNRFDGDLDVDFDGKYEGKSVTL